MLLEVEGEVRGVGEGEGVLQSIDWDGAEGGWTVGLGSLGVRWVGGRASRSLSKARFLRGCPDLKVASTGKSGNSPGRGLFKTVYGLESGEWSHQIYSIYSIKGRGSKTNNILRS